MDTQPVLVLISSVVPEKTGEWRAVPCDCGVIGSMAQSCYRIFAADATPMGEIEFWDGDFLYYVTNLSLGLKRMRRQTVEECVLYIATMWERQERQRQGI